MTKSGTVCYHLTSRCNQNCVYCFRFRDLNELSDEKKFLILQGLSDIGVENICWTGGEPMLTDSIIPILSFTRECNINNRLITNASLLNKEVVTKLSSCLYDLNITLDSTNNEINQKLGRGTDHYNNVNGVISLANELGLKTCINTVVTSINKNCLVDLAHYLNTKQISEWRLFRFNPLNGLALENTYLAVSDDEYKNILSEMSKLFKHIVTKKDHSDFNRINILPNGEVLYSSYGNHDILLGNAALKNFDWTVVKSYLD